MRAKGVSGVDDCSAFCLADPDCVAFDLNLNRNYWCWMFTNQEQADNTRPATGINHYKRVKAGPAGCDG